MARLRLPMRTFCSLVLATLVLFLLVTTPSVLRAQPGGQQPATPAADADGWRTYADTDPLLDYSGQWSTFQVANAFGGTLTGSDDADASLTVHFEGTGVRVLYAKGPEGGDFTGQIDEFWRVYGDALADSYSYGHVMAFEDIEPGNHTLRVVNGKGAIWIEAIEVQGVLLDTTVPEAGLSLLFSETFDNTDFTGWNANTGLLGLMLAPRDQGRALQVTGYLPPLHLMVGGLGDQQIRADILIEGGAARFSLSRSATGEYLIAFHASGQIDVYRDETLLATGNAGAFSPGEWRTVQMTVGSGSVAVDVDDVEYVTVSDPSPPGPGTLSVLPDVSVVNSFQIDNLEVWVPSGDLPVSQQEMWLAPVPLMETSGVGFDVPFLDLVNSIGVTSAVAHECVSTASPYDPINICINSGPPILEGVPSGYRQVYDSPDWSPDGSLIAVAHAQQWGIDFAYYIDVVDEQGEFYPAGSGAIQIDGITINDPITDIAWSPDGAKLAFAMKYNNDPFQIYTVDATCRGVCGATHIAISGGGNLTDPAWSPDGSELAFASDASGAWAVYTVSASGGDPTRISPADGGYTAPSWAPDGIKVVARYSDGVTTHIRLMDSIPGTPLLAVPVQGGSCTGAPDYAPDAASGIVCRTNPLQVVSTTDATYQDLTFSGNDPSWGGQTYQQSDTCKVRVIEGQEQNSYDHPVPARTERFGVVPPDTPAAVFQASDELELDGRYDRDGTEEYIYRVVSENGNELVTPLWIASNQGALTQEGVLEPGDCSTLASLTVEPRGEPGTPEYEREELIENIRDYGVNIISDGLEWSNEDINEIVIGLGRIAEAYSLMEVIGENWQQQFRTVMFEGNPPDEPDYIWIMRLATTVPPDSLYSDYYVPENDPANVPGGAGVCFTFQGLNPPDNPKPRAVTCRGSLVVTQHTIVHEFGHIFDNRSTGSRETSPIGNPDDTGQLRFRVQHYLDEYGFPDDQGRSLRDCGFVLNGSQTYPDPLERHGQNERWLVNVVMGLGAGPVPYGPWKGGDRGWGSVGAGITPFQQHPPGIFVDEDQAGEVAADMFLNWVYRRTSEDPTYPVTDDPDGACNPELLDGDWEGFKNINAKGELDLQLPGNRRYWWMEQQVNDILTVKLWK